MGEIQYKPEGSVLHSLSSFGEGLWNEVASIPGNIAQHYKDHTVTAALETFLPPLLLIDAEVRAHDNANAPLSDSESAVKKMVEDSVLKGNQDNLRDLMVMHSGDPSALNRIMTEAQKDLTQFGLNVNYNVDADGHGHLRVASGKHFVTTDSDGTQTFGDIKNGQDVKAPNGANVQQYLQNLSRDAQQYAQQRFH